MVHLFKNIIKWFGIFGSCFILRFIDILWFIGIKRTNERLVPTYLLCNLAYRSFPSRTDGFRRNLKAKATLETNETKEGDKWAASI